MINMLSAKSLTDLKKINLIFENSGQEFARYVFYIYII